MSERNRGLGKGLSALFGEPDPDVAPTIVERAPGANDPAEGPRGARALPIEFIRPNYQQPRRHFDEGEIEDLAASIRAKGVLQPILVRPVGDDSYEIVAGERRWRASQKAGLHEIPAVVRKLSDSETMEIALIENVQRSDLGPLEEADGYRVLNQEFGRTQAQIAEMIGKSRAHVANMMRLLELPEGVRKLLETGQLTAGHARAIATAPNAVALAEEIVQYGLSVRQAEALARKDEAGGKPKSGKAPKSVQKDPDTAALEADLEASLGLSVSLHDTGGGKGELRLKYATLEQLDDLCRRLTGG